MATPPSKLGQGNPDFLRLFKAGAPRPNVGSAADMNQLVKAIWPTQQIIGIGGIGVYRGDKKILIGPEGALKDLLKDDPGLTAFDNLFPFKVYQTSDWLHIAVRAGFVVWFPLNAPDDTPVDGWPAQIICPENCDAPFDVFTGIFPDNTPLPTNPNEIALEAGVSNYVLYAQVTDGATEGGDLQSTVDLRIAKYEQSEGVMIIDIPGSNELFVNYRWPIAFLDTSTEGQLKIHQIQYGDIFPPDGHARVNYRNGPRGYDPTFIFYPGEFVLALDDSPYAFASSLFMAQQPFSKQTLGFSGIAPSVSGTGYWLKINTDRWNIGSGQAEAALNAAGLQY